MTYSGCRAAKVRFWRDSPHGRPDGWPRGQQRPGTGRNTQGESELGWLARTSTRTANCLQVRKHTEERSAQHRADGRARSHDHGAAEVSAEDGEAAVSAVDGPRPRYNRRLTRLLVDACGATWDAVEYVPDRKGHDHGRPGAGASVPRGYPCPSGKTGKFLRLSSPTLAEQSDCGHGAGVVVGEKTYPPMLLLEVHSGIGSYARTS